MAAAYGAAAFVLGQGVAIASDALVLPPWVLTFVVVVLIAGFPLAVGLSWAFDITPEGLQRTPPRGPLQPASTSGGSEAGTALAVLPFVSMGPGDEDAAFSDGLSEEILNALAGMDGLQVVSRTSSFAFRGRDRDVREIAASLGAAAVLEGSVRGGADGVRITAQLIRGSDGFHLFSETYDRPLDDPLAVQEEISRAISHAVRKAVGFADPSSPEGSHPEARDQVRLGLALLEKRTLDELLEARKRFEVAVSRDPDLATAHAGLAEALARLGDLRALPADEAFPNAVAAARQAVELDEGLAHAHAVLGFVRLLYWDWKGVERHFRRALEVDPDSATAHRWYSLYLSALGRLPDAIRQAEEALRLDPKAPAGHAALAALHYYDRSPARAVECARRALEQDPDDLFARVLQGMAQEAQGDRVLAKATLKEAMADVGTTDPLLLAALARVRAASGDRPGALALLARLEKPARAQHVSGFLRAAVHDALDRKDDAYSALEDAVVDRDGWLLALKIHPWMDGLRDDDRFGPILERVGLEREGVEAPRTVGPT